MQRSKTIKKLAKKPLTAPATKAFEIPNIPLVILVIGFLVVGLLMVFSSSAVLANSTYNDPFYFLKKEVILIIIGIAIGFVMFVLPLTTLRKLSVFFLIVGFLLLLYLVPQSLFHITTPGVITLNDATRWIRIPFLFDIQPAEFIKIAMIMFTAYWLTLGKEHRESLTKFINKYRAKNEAIYYILSFLYYLFPIIIVGLIGLLVLAEKDLSTVVVVVLTFICIFYSGGTTKEHTTITIALIIVSIITGIAAMTLVSYRQERLNSYFEILFKGEPSDKQGNSFQIWNGIVGIGSGGLFGLGYGESRQKLFFLQEAAYTDSIFAVFAEEFGLLGTVVLILSFAYFVSLGFQIARDANDKFLSLIAIGITCLIAIQAFFNIGANLAVIPFGGIPLPFISYGGSYTVTTLALVGLLLNISKPGNQLKKNKLWSLKESLSPI